MIADRLQRTVPAFRTDRLAAVSAKENELMMKFSPFIFGKISHQFFFDLQDVVFRISDLQTSGNSGNMRIYRKSRDIETVAENDVCGLASHSRKRFQFFPLIGDLLTALL